MIYYRLFSSINQGQKSIVLSLWSVKYVLRLFVREYILKASKDAIFYGCQSLLEV
jgi:hypothetical protein